MELKAWEYDEFPEFSETVEGATWLDTTGDEQGVQYVNGVEYECIDGVSRVLQILIPTSRTQKLPATTVRHRVIIPAWYTCRGRRG